MNIKEALEIGESLCASEAEEVLANEVRRLRAENTMLTEQLAQEQRRLDWALERGARVSSQAGVIVSDVSSGSAPRLIAYYHETPRATIDVLIAAEAAGGGK